MHRLVSVLAAFVLVSLFPSFAHAFCVYNKTDVSQQVNEWDGGRSLHMMAVSIDPGGSACCNWQTEDCNSSKSRTSTLSFATTSHPDYMHANVSCGNPPDVNPFLKTFGSYPPKSWSLAADGWANIILATPTRPPSDFRGRVYIIDIYDASGSFKGLYDCKM